MRGAVAAGAIALVALAAAACSMFTDSSGLTGTSATDAEAPDSGAASDAVTTHVDDGAADAQANANAYRDAVLADKPLAYWPFDEAAGATFAKDVVGGVVAPVVTSAKFGVAGAVNGAVEFDGTGYLSVGDHFDFVGAQPFSIELWAKTPTSDGLVHNVVEKRGNVANELIGYVVYFGGEDGGTSQVNVQEWMPGGGARGGWGDVKANELVHVVWTFDGTKVRLYADGVELAKTYTADGGPVDTSAALVIGAGYKGTLDELALYDHALSIERVSEHFTRGHK